jgi:hypothetical protein
LKGEIEDIDEITSLRQVRELFLQFRQMYRKLEKKVIETGSIQKKPETEEEKKSEVHKEKDVTESKGVGDKEETSAGFGLGKALKDSKPKIPVDVTGKAKKIEEDEEAKEPTEEDAKEEPTEEMPGSEIKAKKEKKVEVLDRQTVPHTNFISIGIHPIQEG